MDNSSFLLINSGPHSHLALPNPEWWHTHSYGLCSPRLVEGPSSQPRSLSWSALSHLAWLQGHLCLVVRLYGQVKGKLGMLCVILQWRIWQGLPWLCTSWMDINCYNCLVLKHSSHSYKCFWRANPLHEPGVPRWIRHNSCPGWTPQVESLVHWESSQSPGWPLHGCDF